MQTLIMVNPIRSNVEELGWMERGGEEDVQGASPHLREGLPEV